MFQYLPHRRRLCDEPYQVHPPAAPAALQRKHPVDARQQLRPHIARPLSRPRGAGNFAQSQLYYDGLAADVHEAAALDSAALMLMIVILFKTPRRSLIFGKKFKFQAGFMQAVRQYHGYLFS